MKNKLPYNVFNNPNDWDKSPRDPISIAAAITGIATTATGAAAVGLWATSFLVGLGISAVTSWAMAALTGKPKGQDRGLITNIKDAAAPREYVYGEVRKGGVITYVESTGEDNKFLHLVLTMAAHEVESITAVRVNDELVTIETATTYSITYAGARETGAEGDPEPFTTVFEFSVPPALDYAVSASLTEAQFLEIEEQAYSKEVTSGSEYGGNVNFTSATVTSKDSRSGYVTGDKWKGKVRIEAFTGNQTVGAGTLFGESEVLVGTEGAKFIGYGIAYMYIRLEYDTEVFPNGIPTFTATVRGKKVYDPRTTLTAYSANAALCIRDYLVSEYGMDDAGFTDDTVFAVAANVCDEDIDLVTAGTQPRYEINGVVSAASTPGDILQSMTTACAGTLFWGQGKWQLKPGYYTAPTKTLTLDDLRGPISLSTRVSRRDNFNIVRGTFNNKDARYIQEDYPEIKSAVFIAEDNGLENALDLTLPLTTDSAMAQRLAKLTLFRGREQMSFTAEFGVNAFDVQVGDIIAFTNTRYGWDAKEFEVLAWDFHSSQDAGDLRVTLTLQETSSAAFDWNAEESDIIGNNTTLPVFSAGLTVSSLFVYEANRVTGDGTSISTAVLSWAKAPSSFVDHYEVEWKVTTDLNYASTITTGYSVELSPIVDGVEYTFRVRAVTVSSIKGEWATTTLTGGGDSIAPADPTSLTAEGDLGFINLSWVNPADLDFKETEIWEGSTTSLGSALKIANAAGSSFNRGNLAPLTTRYYWIRSVDYSGNTSNYVGPVSGTSRQVTAADIGPAVIPWDALDPTGEAAIASQVSALSAEIDGEYATISTINIIEDSVDGLEGKYGVTVDLNGNISGFQLLSGIGGSAFNVRADQFAVFNSSGTAGDQPFTIFTSPRTVNGVTFPAGTYITDAYIDYASFVDASVDTLQIKGEAVIVPVSTTDTINKAGGAADGPVQTVVLTLDVAAEVLITWSGAQGYTGSSAHAVKLVVNGDVKQTRGGDATNDMPNMAWSGNLIAGTHTIVVWWVGTNSAITLDNGTLSAFGAKR